MPQELFLQKQFINFNTIMLSIFKYIAQKETAIGRAHTKRKWQY